MLKKSWVLENNFETNLFLISKDFFQQFNQFNWAMSVSLSFVKLYSIVSLLMRFYKNDKPKKKIKILSRKSNLIENSVVFSLLFPQVNNVNDNNLTIRNKKSHFEMKMLISATIRRMDQKEEDGTRSSMCVRQNDCARQCRPRAVPPSHFIEEYWMEEIIYI